jgi:RNA polymerase sigma factor (sigma-70 family)
MSRRAATGVGGPGSWFIDRAGTNGMGTVRQQGEAGDLAPRRGAGFTDRARSSVAIGRDERLISAVRVGDAGAFELIYDRHAAELVSFCRHMLGSQVDAEDAAQQVFLKAYRGIRESRAPIALRPWLFTIARNECVSMLRRRREVPADHVEPDRDGRCPAGELALREELQTLLHDLARLPAEQREALLLSGVERLSGEEIAEILETDRDRVKALVFRARRALEQAQAARQTSCEEIQAQLEVLRGGSLRRRVIREHLVACEACRDFRADVRRRRQGSATGHRFSHNSGQARRARLRGDWNDAGAGTLHVRSVGRREHVGFVRNPAPPTLGALSAASAGPWSTGTYLLG